MLGFLELKYNWRKYMLVQIIVVLMMFMVLFLSGLVGGLGRAMGSGIENMRTKQFLLSEKAEKLIPVSSINLDDYRKIKEEYASKVALLNMQRAHIQREGKEEKIDITYMGIGPDEFLIPKIIEGDNNIGSANSIILNDSFKLEGVSIGDYVVDAYSQTKLKVVGFTKDSTYSHVAMGFVSNESYNVIMKGANPLHENNIRAIAINGKYKNNIKGLQLVSKEEVLKAIPGRQAQLITVKMVQWLLVVITSLVIGIFFFVVNMQKEKEFGVLKAIGIKMRTIIKGIVMQVSIICVSGALVSVALVVLLSTVLPPQLPFFIIAYQMILIPVVFIIISILASLATIVRIYKIDPATIIGGDFQ